MKRGAHAIALDYSVPRSSVRKRLRSGPELHFAVAICTLRTLVLKFWHVGIVARSICERGI